MSRDFFKKDKWLIAAGCGLFLAFFFAFYFPQVWALITEETKQSSKTIKFFIFQSPTVLVSPTSTSTDFSIFIGEQSPIVKDAYIEIRGVTQISASQQITADIKERDSGSFPTERQKQFTLDSSGKPNYFKFFYASGATSTLTSFFDDVITGPGTYNFTSKIDISGADISLLQARMVITYQFTPPSAGTGTYYASTEIVSPVFETNAANGVQYNWITVFGSKPVGTNIKAQLATSNSSSTGFTFKGGSDCSQTSYYVLTPTESTEIKCFSDHNNKRYFQYKIILCSSTDCSTTGNATPQINDVIVNWSP